MESLTLTPVGFLAGAFLEGATLAKAIALASAFLSSLLKDFVSLVKCHDVRVVN